MAFLHVPEPFDAFPLSAQQAFHWETLLFRCLGREIAGRDGPFIALRLSGPFDTQRFERALAAMVERHEILRTVLTCLCAAPQQRVFTKVCPPFARLDLHEMPAAWREQLAENVVAAERACEFDLLNGPLWRSLAVSLSRDAHILVLHFCHLVIDGVSLMIFLDELSRLYDGRHVPPIRYQYRHFVEQSLVPPSDLEKRLAYWRSQLPTPGSRFSFPTDYSANPPSLLSGEVLRFRRSFDETRMKEICRTASATPFMLYLAAYAIVLTQTGASERVVFASSLARVDLKPDENILGYSLDMLLIPVRVRRNQSIAEVISAVRDSLLAAQQNAVPFTALAAALNPDFDNERPWPGLNLYDAWVRGRVFELADGNFSPFGESAVSLYSMTEGYLERPFTHPRQTDTYARCYLPALYLDDSRGSSGYLEYNRAVFLPTTAARISSRIGALLGQMSAPATSVEHAWNSLKKAEALSLLAK